MRSVSQALAVAAVIGCIAPLSFAQPKPAAPTPSPAAPAPKPALPAAKPPPLPSSTAPALPPGAAPSAAPSSSAAPQLPPPAGSATAAGTAAPQAPSVDVDDPQLAPVPAATHILGGFREVLSLLSNQATSLRIAKAEIDRAKGARRQSLAAVLPTMTGTANFTVQAIRSESLSINPTTGAITTTQSPASPTGSMTLGVVQPFNARSYYAIGTADENIEGTKLRYEDARRTAIAAAANAVVTVVTSERVADINRVSLRAALQRLELTKRKKRLGSGTDLDVVRAEQDATTSRGQVVTGDESLRKSRESLGQLFNSTDSYGVAASFSLNDIETAMKSACQTDKPENRTDVLAAKSDLKVAERSVTDVKLSYAPTAQISSTLSVTPDALLATPSGQNATWSITALLSVPIWDGGARYGAAKIAAAQVEEAKAKVDQTVVTATLESTQAQRSITVAEQARVIAEKARDLAKETARLSQIAFETGAGTSLDLITSGQALRQAELDLAVKELSVVQSKIAALLALSKCDL